MEQNKSFETISEEIYKLESLDNEFKTTVLNILKELKENRQKSKEIRKMT